MSRCVHAFVNRPVMVEHVRVTVLTCLRCGKRLVQTYRCGHDGVRAVRLFAVEVVRKAA